MPTRCSWSVLSPTTAATDFDRKLQDYQQMPAMQDVLLMSSTERLVRHWWRRPDGWTERRHRRGDASGLAGLPVRLTMSELYDGVLP